MPRKVAKEERERPKYLNPDGSLNFDGIFKFQPKQTELLQWKSKNGVPYLRPMATQCLSVGGIRSGKTSGVLMYFVFNYSLAFEQCDILILRRTFKELESGAIADFKTFMPKELYTYDQTKHVATLFNGSRVVFGHCLAEGTLITTQRGLVPIEDVTTEDFALTRKGFKRILWSGKTGEKPVVQLGPLSITNEHKVFVDKEWRETQECLKDSEKTVSLLCHKPSYLKTMCITDTRNLKDAQTECTSKVGDAESKPTYTLQCGNKSLEKSQTVLKCTTKMGTLRTMCSTTLNLSRLGITEGITLHGELDDLEDQALSSWGLDAGSVESLSSQKVERKDFATLTVETLSEQTLNCVPVYDLQVEEEHEFFANGVLVHNCQNNKERDIEQYLGQAYPAILIDEAGQFSPDAWQMLYSRNTVNASCKPDANGNLPIPCIWGCTNPLGPFYEYYRTVFVEKEPWLKPEEARKDETNGTWWVPEGGEWRLIYDPRLYASQRSTVMDNPELLKRDPGIIARLNSLPKAKRDKMLLGLDGKFEGQYFDVFDPEYHVVNPREDDKAIIWQDWQPVWGSQDWGMGHANAAYLFTRALVRSSVGTDYKLKTVCFRETVTQGGKSHREWASIFKMMCKRPDGKEVIPKSIFFSHEKFSRQTDMHTPADEYSKSLRAVGLPGVTRGTQDRIGSATLMYNMLKNGELVILDNCRDIILAIPSLMRNPDVLDDVLKVDAKGDDCYDGFRLGLYGQYSARKRPNEDLINEHSKTLDPLAAFFYRQKMNANKGQENVPFVQGKRPVWMDKAGI